MGSGLTLDEILNMTFDQIQMSAMCITKVKVEFLNSIAEPLMGALGAEYKPASSDDPKKARPKKKKNLTDKDKIAREQAKLAGLRSLGIDVPGL